MKNKTELCSYYKIKELYTDQYDCAMATVSIDDRLAEYEVSSNKFKGHIMHTAYQESGEIITGSKLENLLEYFCGLAAVSQKSKTLSVRTGRDSDGNIVLDSVNSVIKITDNEWETIPHSGL